MTSSGFWKSGDPFIWLTGGALAFSLLMVAALVLMILVNGLGFFWPGEVLELTLEDCRTVLGQVDDREDIPAPRDAAHAGYRVKIKQGNRDLYGSDFVWIDEPEVSRRAAPDQAVVFERREWGNLYGSIMEVREGGRTIAAGEEEGWRALQERLAASQELHRRVQRLRDVEIGAINHEVEAIRLRLRRLELAGSPDPERVQAIEEELARWQDKYSEQEARLTGLRARLAAATVLVGVAGGREKELPIGQIVRAYRPNRMGIGEKVGFYFSKVWEFLSDDPRESNTEGGIFPAIFGTVMMVMIMSLAVTPVGILAALYLREYARQGLFVSAVRIAVNNLAGVPSIVFGVFGVGFFIYFIGGNIDRAFFPELLPTPTFGTGGILWASLTLALLTVPTVIVATEEGLAAIPRGLREASLALGATKLETTWRVVLPVLTPSIMTGMILAIARAAGEVAPLMLTGVVKLAPSLPVDGYAPYVHLDRKFMHLGFHIYDVALQSPNVDAARPMVFATTLVLLLIIIALNLTATILRRKLRRKYAGTAI